MNLQVVDQSIALATVLDSDIFPYVAGEVMNGYILLRAIATGALQALLREVQSSA